MKLIRPCSSCAAPLTLKMVTCPHCDAPNLRGRAARIAAAIAGVVGSVSLGSTLAACYGAPCANGGTSCLNEIPPPPPDAAACPISRDDAGAPIDAGCDVHTDAK